MANYSSLLAAVNAAITANGTGAITGPVLNSVLQQMIVSLGQGGYIFKGRAIPTTDPGSPDQNVFYIATTPGTYTNFSSIVVAAGECAILKGSGTSWSKEATGIDLVSVSQNSQTGHTDINIGSDSYPVASVEEASQLGQEVDGLELDVKGIKEYDGSLSIGTLYPDGKVYPVHDTFRTTDYIFLKSGQRFVSTAVNEIVGGQSYPNMCVYSVPDVSGLISAISAQSAQGFEYTATQDCYVRFSNSLEKWVAPNIVEDNSIESRLGGIEPQVADLTLRLNETKVFNNLVSYSGNANVGALHNDGKLYPEHTTFRTTDFIHLLRGMSLYSSKKNEIVNVQSYPNLCVYSSANENSFIAGVYATQQYGFQFTATQDCYVRFTNLDEYFSLKIDDILTPIAYPYEVWINKLSKDLDLVGEKVGFLGDSITDYGQYTSAFAEKTGAIIFNYGVSGTTIANSSAGQSFIQRVAQMDNDLDIVVVFGGVNDQRLPVPLGVFENRNADGSLDSTFYGALHTLCRSLFAKYAGKPIIFITPMHNSYRDETYGDTGDINYYEYTTNGLIVENKFPLRDKTYIDDSIAVGDILSKYRKAIIDVCALYSFPVIDMYAISGFFPIIEQNAQLYTLDGIHPNAFGGNHIADLMIPKIIELLNS